MRFFGIVIWCELAFGLEMPGMGLSKRHLPSVNDIMLANWKRSPFHKRGYSPVFNDPEMYGSILAKRGIQILVSNDCQSYRLKDSKHISVGPVSIPDNLDTEAIQNYLNEFIEL